MRAEILLAFLQRPIRFSRNFIMGVLWARRYEKTVGVKFKDM